MVHIPAQRRPVVLNPDGGPLQIDDLPAFLAQYEEGGPFYDEEPMIDLGGGMEVPLAELADTLADDEEETD